EVILNKLRTVHSKVSRGHLALRTSDNRPLSIVCILSKHSKPRGNQKKSPGRFQQTFSDLVARTKTTANKTVRFIKHADTYPHNLEFSDVIHALRGRNIYDLITI
ncbi:Hypothetical protein CINCED_3A011492, partial [Cinara cedri]